MSDPNEFLKGAIAAYLARLTDYALLITGPWGSGKTYQVKTALQASHSNRLYVSAAGASSSEELNFRLVVAATPFLGTKFASIGEQVVSGLLSRVKIDYKIKLSDFAKVPASAVVVIDDIERFNANPSILLAFANSLVEHSDRKVVMLAAENEYTTDQLYQFSKTKEKVVGQQLTVRPDPSGLIRGLLYRIPADYQKFLIEYQEDILLVFNRLAQGNLRSLKRFIFDFHPVFIGLSAGRDQKVESKSVVRVAQTLLAFTFAARRNDIDRAMLARRPESSFMAAFLEQGSAGQELEPLLSIGKSLPEIDLYDQTVGDDLIMSFVFEGFIEPGLIERTRNDLLIGKGGDSAEPWRVLWHYLDVDETDFAKALPAFLDQFFKREFVDAGEVIHAFGILFELSEAKLIPYTQDQISEMVEAYTDDIISNRKFDLTLGGVLADHRHGAAFGLGFHQLKNQRMAQAVGDLKRKAEDKRQTDLVTLFTENFGPGRNFEPQTAIDILLGTQPSTSLRGVPFLQRVSAGTVARTICYSNPDIQGSILRAISSRFAQEQQSVVETERPWIRQLIDSINSNFEKLSSDLVRRRLSQMIEWYLLPLLHTDEPETVEEN